MRVIGLLPIAIEIFQSLVPTPPGIGGRPLYHLYHLFFVILLHTIGLYIQSRLSPLGVKRLTVVLLGFLASLRVSLYNLPYTTNNHLSESSSDPLWT